MAANIGEIRLGVNARIKDIDGRLTTSPDIFCDVDRATLSALSQYQKLRPRQVTLKITGTGTFDYPVSTVLTGFVDGFSSVLGVVYPYVAANQDLTLLETEEHALVRIDTGLQLRFVTARPATTEFFLATFTAPHTLNASTSTVLATDDDALQDLAAAECCDRLAALYAKDVDSSISADAVDRRNKSDVYRSLAKEYRGSYAAKLQLGGDGSGQPAVAAAVAMADIDRPGFGRRGLFDYFVHDRRTS